MINFPTVIGAFAGCAVATAVLTGCGASTPVAGSSVAGSASASPAESNPAGDITDNQAFVEFTEPDRSFTVRVPEGWAQITAGADVVFSDKYNSITLAPRSGFYQPTEAFARTVEVPEIAAATKGFVAGDVKTVQRPAGQVVLITYRADSPPSPVTGKSVVQAVERYEFSRSDRGVVMTMSVPDGSDNVDPWRTVTDSFSWLP